MKPASSNLWTLAFSASTVSSDILQSFYFLGFTLRFTCNMCSMISPLTPTWSKVDHAKTSLFLSRKASNSTCSSGLVSMPRQTALTGTLGSNATFLKWSSASMAFLNYVKASAMMGHTNCWYCSDSCLRKWTFLRPDMKPCSMFLASFWLPKIDITLNVGGILR
jgi:hypothetical protein